MRVWQALSLLGCFVWSVNCYALNLDTYEAKKLAGTLTTEQGDNGEIIVREVIFDVATGAATPIQETFTVTQIQSDIANAHDGLKKLELQAAQLIERIEMVKARIAIMNAFLKDAQDAP